MGCEVRLAKADKKASRIAAEGRIVTAQTAQGRCCRGELRNRFVAKDESFLKFSEATWPRSRCPPAPPTWTLKAAAYPGAASVEEAGKALIATIGEKIDVRRLARVESDGVIGSYIHGGRIAPAALKAAPEAGQGRGDACAAMNPAYARAEDVPADFLAKEKDIALSQMSDKEKASRPKSSRRSWAARSTRSSRKLLPASRTCLTPTSALVTPSRRKVLDVISVARLAVAKASRRSREDFAAEADGEAGLARSYPPGSFGLAAWSTPANADRPEGARDIAALLVKGGQYRHALPSAPRARASQKPLPTHSNSLPGMLRCR